MNRPARTLESRIAWTALALAALALLLLLLSGPGARLGWWHFRTGFSMLRWAAYLGMATLVVGLVAAALNRPGTHRGFSPRDFGVAILAVVLATGAVFVPWRWQRVARAAPPIHDITTDTQNPPEFIAIAPLRADAPNPVAYAGMETAATQRTAYPDIQPLLLGVPAEEAFRRALDAAARLGWQIVVAEAAAGRIEATDRTRWFGFYDDVVVRVTPVDANRSVVDVRSKSRVGRGDAGANARRIRSFVEEMDAR
jgi:uncharacterized protein (DUF1499 family)